MFATAKTIVDYITYLLAYRKTKWGLTVGLLPIAVLWVSFVRPPYKADNEQFVVGFLGCLALSSVIIVVWLFHSRRIILGDNIFTIVLSLKAKDPKSNEYIQSAISILRSELDALGLLNKFRILLAGTDIINCTKKAQKYRESFDLDLLIWGEVFSGKKAQQEVYDFKRLCFTYKIPPQIVIANLTDLFKTDINISLTNRDWNVYEFNSLPDLEKISGHLMEIIMFVLGIVYSQSRVYTKDSIIVLERLFTVLESKSKNEQIEVSPEKGALTMSPTMLRKGRVLAILLNIYKNLGTYFTLKKKYQEGFFYSERFMHYSKRNIEVLANLALCSFFLNDYESAKRYTEEIGKIDKHNEFYISNRAFFGIWEKNYSSALHFYKEFVKRGHAITAGVVMSVISFLDDRKSQHNKEIAYDFAIGLLDYYFLQKSTGEKELQKFLKSAKNKDEYKEMVGFVEQLIFKKRKKKK